MRPDFLLVAFADLLLYGFFLDVRHLYIRCCNFSTYWLMFNQFILSHSVMYGNADFLIEVFIVCYHPFKIFKNVLSHVAHQLEFSTLSVYAKRHYPPSYFRFLMPFGMMTFAFSNLLYPHRELGFAYAWLTFFKDPIWT